MKKLFCNKIFKFVYTTLKIIFFAILISYVAFIALQRLTGNKSIFGYRLFTVVTSSMSGVYDVNDVIVVKDCDVESLTIGDDIAYIGSRGGLENKLISHRIVKIEDSNGTKIFTTKGVKNDVEDPSITADQILGQIIGVVPIITQVNHVIHTQIGFFGLIFCPLVVIIVLEVLQTITEIKLEKNELEIIEKDSDKKDSLEEDTDEIDSDKKDFSEEDTDEIDSDKKDFSEEDTDKIDIESNENSGTVDESKDDELI